MPPGGATPRGALGYVSAALELAEQVAAGACPAPAVVVVGVGSTCTSAGLLLGFHHAARRGLGLARAPRLVAARVSPWPITAAFRIVSLAHRASALLAALAGDPSLEVPAAALAAGLEVDGRCLGRGYGYPTESGRDAIRVFEASGHRLDATYGAKSAAAFLRRLRDGERRPMLYWATKSSAPLPGPDPEVVAAAPARLRRWLDRGGRRGTV